MKIRDGVEEVIIGAVIAVLVVYAILFVVTAKADDIPAQAHKYRLDLTRQSRMAWGIDAPIATFAGQIHQESAWNANAKSRVGAAGLAQFMPATATWISGIDPKLKAGEVYNPTWAIRALVVYDKWIFDRLMVVDGQCYRMQAALRGYNGGLGYLFKEIRSAGCADIDAMASQCLKHRKDWACRENLDYPKRIMRHEARYQHWGPRSC